MPKASRQVGRNSSGGKINYTNYTKSKATNKLQHAVNYEVSHDDMSVVAARSILIKK